MDEQENEVKNKNSFFATVVFAPDSGRQHPKSQAE